MTVVKHLSNIEVSSGTELKIALGTDPMLCAEFVETLDRQSTRRFLERLAAAMSGWQVRRWPRSNPKVRPRPLHYCNPQEGRRQRWPAASHQAFLASSSESNATRRNRRSGPAGVALPRPATAICWRIPCKGRGLLDVCRIDDRGERRVASHVVKMLCSLSGYECFRVVDGEQAGAVPKRRRVPAWQRRRQRQQRRRSRPARLDDVAL